MSIEPVPEDRLAEIYPSSYYSYSTASASPLERIKAGLERRLYRSVFSQLKGEQLAALDVGGGSGWILDQARQVEPRLATTVVVDIDSGAEVHARSAGHDFVLSRIETFTYPARFDLVIMFNLVEHVKDPRAVLAKARNLLAPGGVILVKTPNCDSLDARLFRRTYWGGLHSPRHWSLFTPEGFRRAAAAAGLRVERLQLTQGAPFWTWSILDLMARTGLARFSPERPMHRHPLTPLLFGLFAAVDYARRPFMRTSQMFAVLTSG